MRNIDMLHNKYIKYIISATSICLLIVICLILSDNKNKNSKLIQKHQIKNEQSTSHGSATNSLRPENPFEAAVANMKAESSNDTTNVYYAEGIEDEIEQFLEKPIEIVPINFEKKEAVNKGVHSWISAAIDFSKANMRESSRFLRSSFIQEKTEDKPLFLDDRLSDLNQRKGLGSDITQQLDRPLYTNYRVGDDGSYHKLFKDKEIMQDVGEGLDDSTAIEKSKMFMTENEFIEESTNDKIEYENIRKVRANEKESAQTPEQDYVVRKDILMGRQYKGKPVINSQAIIGLLPENDEIVLFKLQNWLPVGGDGENTNQNGNSIETAHNEPKDPVNLDDIKNKVLDTITNNVIYDVSEATIEKVDEAWFQTDDQGLIPVLAFTAQFTYKTEGVDPESDIFIVNPYGSNDILQQQGRIPRAETNEQPL